MSDLCFKKVIDIFGSVELIIFERGQLGKPICILCERDVEEIKKELKQKHEVKN